MRAPQSHRLSPHNPDADSQCRACPSREYPRGWYRQWALRSRKRYRSEVHPKQSIWRSTQLENETFVQITEHNALNRITRLFMNLRSFLNRVPEKELR